MRPVRYPSLASATARFTATVVLPTPPLPLPTATTCDTPGKGCGPCGAPAPICPITFSPNLSDVPLVAKRGTHLFLPLRLACPHLAPPSSIFVPALLVVGLRNHLRHHNPLPLHINGHVGQVSRRDV